MCHTQNARCLAPRSRFLSGLSAAGSRAVAALVGLASCAILASLAAGCDGIDDDPALVTSTNANMIFVDGAKEFEQKVLRSDKPVMVEFFKASCPTCVLQEVWMNELAEEYKGRVLFARMRIRDMAMNPTCPEIMDKYKLFWVPTEVLFLNGQEKQRWNGPWNYPKEVFREGINDALLEQSRPRPLAAQPQRTRSTGARLVP